MGRPFGPRPHGLGMAQSERQPTCRHRVRAPGALTARSPCLVRVCDGAVAALVGGAMVLSWRQGLADEHQGSSGEASGMVTGNEALRKGVVDGEAAR
jgi:hypothetical protein